MTKRKKDEPGEDDPLMHITCTAGWVYFATKSDYERCMATRRGIPLRNSVGVLYSRIPMLKRPQMLRDTKSPVLHPGNVARGELYRPFLPKELRADD